MKKLNKNFLNTGNKTVEAMQDSCLDGCSCGLVSCLCNEYKNDNYATWDYYQKQSKNAYKNAAW